VRGGLLFTGSELPDCASDLRLCTVGTVCHHIGAKPLYNVYMTPEVANAIRVSEGRADSTRLRCRAVRGRAHMSLSVFARLLGVPVPTVAMWEYGQRRPPGDRAIKFLDLIEALEEAFPSDEPAGHTTQVLADQAS
jgi:DNA-binding transcriptional regulator YiaG